ncbi:MAG TPA: hypothetical protein PL158_13920 [Bacillota bacterium]|nr:hypothetical protein [Bacillota bacterium]
MKVIFKMCIFVFFISLIINSTVSNIYADVGPYHMVMEVRYQTTDDGDKTNVYRMLKFQLSPQDELIRLINQAITDPSKDYNLLNFGIDQNWLEQNANLALASQMKSNWNKNQTELYLNSFKNLNLVQETLFNYYQGLYYTTFEPKTTISIGIYSGNRKQFELSSREQREFMLPWKINQDGISYYSYNPKISKVIATYIADEDEFFQNSNIEGVNFKHILAEEVHKKIFTEWEELKSINK